MSDSSDLIKFQRGDAVETVFDMLGADQWVVNESGWSWDYISGTKGSGTIFEGKSVREGHC